MVSFKRKETSVSFIMGFVHHFLHIYFFTEFEIFFYFYYILPYEKKFVLDMFSKQALTNDDDIFNQIITTIHSNGSSYDNQCDAEHERIDANHDELWTYCCAYLIFINAVLFLVFVRDFVMCYRDFALFPRIKGSESTNNNRVLLSSPSFESKHKKTDSDFEFEMVDLEAPPPPTPTMTTTTNVLKNTSFTTYYWEKSDFIAATCKIMQFIVLIGVFEYLFFTLIINKYKVVSGKMLLCKLLEY